MRLRTRALLVVGASLTLALGVGVGPASAHQDHTSCRGFGQGAAMAAQTIHPFGQFVRTFTAGRGASEEVAGLHTSFCEPRP